MGRCCVERARGGARRREREQEGEARAYPTSHDVTHRRVAAGSAARSERRFVYV